MSSRGRAGGARDFCSSACLQSCSWTLSSRTLSVCRRTPLVCSQTDWPEREPSKKFSPARAQSAATCRDRPALERRTRKFSKFPHGPISLRIEAKYGITPHKLLESTSWLVSPRNQGFSEMVHVQVRKMCCRRREREWNQMGRTEANSLWAVAFAVVLLGERNTQLPHS